MFYGNLMNRTYHSNFCNVADIQTIPDNHAALVLKVLTFLGGGQEGPFFVKGPSNELSKLYASAVGIFINECITGICPGLLFSGEVNW